MIPNTLASIIPYNHQPAKVLNVAHVLVNAMWQGTKSRATLRRVGPWTLESTPFERSEKDAKHMEQRWGRKTKYAENHWKAPKRIGKVWENDSADRKIGSNMESTQKIIGKWYLWSACFSGFQYVNLNHPWMVLGLGGTMFAFRPCQNFQKMVKLNLWRSL